MRIFFMGSPEFALPSLRRLIESEHEIVAVFTQPDRPTGRGRKLAPPPVKALALEHGLPVHQPKSISAPDVVKQIRALQPDVGVIAAYGQILKQRLLDVPPLGVLNVHASLLPRWRGASPISAAILADDAETGATIMRVELALDAGPMLASARVLILRGDTTVTLASKVAEAGATLLIDVIPRWQAGTIHAIEQDAALATYAPRIEKRDGLIDWDHDEAATIARQVRAYNPWPSAYSYLDGAPLRIIEAVVLTDGVREHPPGTIVEAEADLSVIDISNVAFAVIAASGALGVIRIQSPGGSVMSAAAYLNGHRGIIGKRLTSG